VVSVYSVKPRLQAAIRPIVTALARAGVRPNAVTIAACVGSIAVGAAVGYGRGGASLLLLPAWLLARMILNAIDGVLAREHAMTSRLGAVLNEMGDVVSDLALYLPLAFVRPAAAVAIVGFSIGAVLTEFAGLLGLAVGSARRYDGPMGKSDRALLVGLLGLVTFVAPGLVKAWTWVFASAAVLTIWTCITRIRRALAAPPVA
jgi:CDP-diacylglycerol--glycerol-3-phosphate 3-phosphatidyltransferase